MDRAVHSKQRLMRFCRRSGIMQENWPPLPPLRPLCVSFLSAKSNLPFEGNQGSSDPMCSDRGSIWTSDIRVSLRRFHRRPNNSFHPFGNAYKPRAIGSRNGQRDAGNGERSGERKREREGREIKGFWPLRSCSDERRDDVENRLYMRGSPEKGYFLFKTLRVLALHPYDFSRSGKVIRKIEGTRLVRM